MKKPKISWRNENWYSFSEAVRHRDGNRCTKCNRNSKQVTLQVHHEKYIFDKLPWEYPLSDCITLCKGCHAREHGIIEPNKGWKLIAIDDLEDLDGTCERNNCNQDIRYAHLTYHPAWGYMTVGSTCIEHLTQEDKDLSSNVLKYYKAIRQFVYGSQWFSARTKKGNKYIGASYRSHSVRIYGKPNFYSFQLVIKQTNSSYYEYGNFIPVRGKNLNQVKELAYIAVRGKTSKNSKEIEILRNIYRSIL